jgi:hypothetical protein
VKDKEREWHYQFGEFYEESWADKSLGILPQDKFIKPSDWSGGCDDLEGLALVMVTKVVYKL